MIYQEKIKKEYLGDGVYADYDNHYFIFTTEDSYHATNKIYLDDDVIDALLKFIKKCKEE